MPCNNDSYDPYPVEELPDDAPSTLNNGTVMTAPIEKEEPEYIEFNDELYSKLKG